MGKRDKISFSDIAEKGMFQFGKKFADSLIPAEKKIDYINAILDVQYNDLKKLVIELNAVGKAYKGISQQKEFINNLEKERKAIQTLIGSKKEFILTLKEQEKLKQEQIKTEKVQLQLQKQKEQGQKRTTKLTVQEKVNQQELNRQKREEAKLNSDVIEAYQKLNIERNKAQKSLKDLLAQGRKSTQTEEEYQGELKKTREEFEKLDNTIKGIDETSKDYSKNIGNYKSAFDDFKDSSSGLFDAVKSGNVEAMKTSFNGVKSSIIGMTKSALAFIATPIGIAITAIAGIGLGVKAWIGFNLEVEKSNKLIRDITNTSGDSTNAIRSRAENLKEIFGVEFKDSIKTAKSLVVGMGISYDEAFTIIEDGAVRGRLSNEEYLDSLKEYSVQFSNAGFSAQEFSNVVGAGIDLSIYSDKLPDAIKEVDLALSEQTKSVSDALKNAFGANFTKDILAKVKKGEITTKQALQSISKQAKKTNLDQQQLAQLTTDLFKGAGEDAGGALKIFEALDNGLNKTTKKLTEQQELQKKELSTKEKLKELTTQIFASESIGLSNTIASGKIWLTEVLIKVLEVGVDIYNWFVGLNNQSGLFSAGLSVVGKIATLNFEILGILIKGAWKSFKGLGNIVKGIFTLDVNTMKKGFSQGVGALGNAIKGVKNKALGDINDIYNAFNGKNKMKKIDLKALVSTEKSEKEKEKAEKLAREKAGKRANEFKKKQLADTHKLEKYTRKLEIEEQNKIKNSEEKSYKERLAALKKYSTLKKELLDFTMNYELREKGLTAPEKKLISLKNSQGKKDIDTQTDEEAGKLYFNRIKKEIKKREELEKELNKDIAKTREAYLGGQITSEEEYQKQIKELKFYNQKDILNNQIDFLEEELLNVTTTAEQKIKVEEDINKKRQQLADVQFNRDSGLKGIENKENKEKKEKKKTPEELIAEVKQDLIEQSSKTFADVFNIDQTNLQNFFTAIVDGFEKGMSKAEQFSEIAKTSVAVIGDIGNNMYAENIEAIDEEIEKSDELYENKLKNIQNDKDANGNLLFDKKKLEEEIQKDKEKAREVLEKKKRKEQRKQAVFNRSTASFEIGINTAVAITKATAALNPALVAMAIMMGGIQLAAVWSKPLPKYKLGRKGGKEELAITGDGGVSEVIENKKTGRLDITPATDTLTYLNEGDIVHKSIPSFIESKENYLRLFRNVERKNMFDASSRVQKQVISNENRLVALIEKNSESASKIKDEIKEGFKNVSIHNKIHNHQNINIEEELIR